MDYWISTDGTQTGPFTLPQLQTMWQEGRLNATSYYYDAVRAEWLLLRLLVENVRGLFSVEEAFVRLGQNRQKGCLTVYNKEETIHLFVDGGFVVCAMSDKDQGEFALSRALHLEESSYDWFFELPPPATNLRQNITEYALKHSIARDVRVSSAVTRKHNTVTIPKNVLDKFEAKPKFNYTLLTEEKPERRFRLDKMNSILGREDSCDVMIDDRQISRKHCLLEAWEQHVKVKDLDSSNGTFINGIPVRDGFLKVGDELKLGSYKLFLQKEEKKAPDLE